MLSSLPNSIFIFFCAYSEYGIKHLSYGIKIAFEDWNERVAPLFPPDNSNRFIKLIRNIRQNVGKMSQDSIDSFKSFFKMNSHNNLSVNDQKTVEVFWSTDPNQWKSEVVKRFKQFKHLVERGPDVQIQAILITVSILLAIWSLCDLLKVFKNCRIIESLIETDKKGYVDDLVCLELELERIITALESLSNDQEEDMKRMVSLGVYESHLPTLHSKTKGIINKIKTFDDKIQNDIEELSNREFHRKNIRIVSALLSLVSVTTTVWNWNKWNAPQRTSGLAFGGATGITAIVAHLNVNQLQQLQETLKQTLTDLKSLNEQLKRIEFAEKYHKSTDYNFLLHEFEGYLQAIKDFKEIFQTKDQKNDLLT